MENKYYITADMLPIMLKPKDVAFFLSVTTDYARELFRIKAFPTTAIGKRRVVSRTDFINWLDKQEINRGKLNE